MQLTHVLPLQSRTSGFKGYLTCRRSELVWSVREASSDRSSRRRPTVTWDAQTRRNSRRSMHEQLTSRWISERSAKPHTGCGPRSSNPEATNAAWARGRGSCRWLLASGGSSHRGCWASPLSCPDGFLWKGGRRVVHELDDVNQSEWRPRAQRLGLQEEDAGPDRPVRFRMGRSRGREARCDRSRQQGWPGRLARRASRPGR